MKDLIPDLKGLWEFLKGIKDWDSLEGWVAKIILALLLLYAVIWLLRQVLEHIIRIRDGLRDLGFPAPRTAAQRLEIKCRQNFCRVLRGKIEWLNSAENWNDQFFADLEAEVEAEGGFYASALHRVFRRQSRGLRRVRSLIGAIESSTEPALLLVGEPGSGKSVALRHLAIQLAEKGSRSHNPDVRIPLYVNLKELPAAP